MHPGIDFESLFARSPNAYMVLDSALRYVAANDAYVRATGAKLEELLGRCIFDVFPNDPDDPGNAPAKLLRESLTRVVQQGVVDTIALIPYRVPQQTADGLRLVERYWSATHTPIFDERGAVAFVLQHTVDVTELHLGKHLRAMEAGVLARAERVQSANLTLDAERRRLRRLFEQAPGFVVFLGGEHHVVDLANDAYKKLIGHREIHGMTIREALPEVEGQGYFEILDRVFRTGVPFVAHDAKVLLQHEPGGPLVERFVDFVYQPITEPDGTISGIFVLGNDVTEQHVAEVELSRYREQLEELVQERTRALEQSEAALRQAQKMEAVGKLTGGIAHDFNNLLQVISGNLQLLLRDLDDERARRRVQTALGAAERGARLSSQLLAFARKQPLQPTAVHLGALLMDMEDLLERALGEDVEIRREIDPGVWHTFADPNQLENVILNLAINSRDAMQGVGQLTVKARNATLDAGWQQRYPDVEPGEYVELAITDTGCGMPPEVLDQAFEPFFTTKPEGRGTGLGLSMVYGFVKQTGGHVEIESEVGRGTTLRIFLPRAKQLDEQVSEREVFEVEGGTETILVVEDDPGVRVTVVDVLTDLGYRVLQAADGQAALALLQQGLKVDLLFTDVVMPGPVRSTELARAARTLLPDLEVLFTSGYAENAIVHDGRIDPGVSLLSKPYRREDLARKLRHQLRNQQQRVVMREALAKRRLSPSRPAPATTPAEHALRVLLVEDDELIRTNTSELLEVMGHCIRSVASAEEARRVLAQEPFDVLFTDLSLPGESGAQLARHVQALRPELKVIVASGHGTAVEASLANAAVLLPKPYDLEGMKRALAEAVRRAV